MEAYQLQETAPKAKKQKVVRCYILLVKGGDSGICPHLIRSFKSTFLLTQVKRVAFREGPGIKPWTREDLAPSCFMPA